MEKVEKLQIGVKFTAYFETEMQVSVVPVTLLSSLWPHVTAAATDALQRRLSLLLLEKQAKLRHRLQCT